MLYKEFRIQKEDNYKNRNDNFINMPQFFDLNPEDLKILNPYDFNESIKRLENLSNEELMNDHFASKEWELADNIGNLNYDINSVKFLTSRIEFKENNFVELLNLDNYIFKDEEKKTYLLKFQNDSRKNEIQIKCCVNYQTFTQNIYENMCEKSIFKSSQILKNVIDKILNEDDKIKKCEFDIIIKLNSIIQIYYTEKGDYLIELQHPPLFKTNFLIDKTKKSKDYESIVFPFRNFKDEIANLKYRKTYILINKNTEKTPENNQNLNQINILSAFQSIFSDKDKIKIVPNINYNMDEDSMKKKSNYIKNMELSEYFKYNSNQEIKQIFLNLGFLKEIKNEEIKNKEEEEEKYDDIYILKFY